MRFNLLILLLIGCFQFNSCGKNDDLYEERLSEDEIKLYLSVNQESEEHDHVSEYIPKVASSKISSFDNTTSSKTIVSSARVFDGIEVFPVVDTTKVFSYSSRNVTYAKENKIAGRNSTSNSFSPLVTGTKIRVLLYFKDPAATNGYGNFYSSTQLKIGASGNIQGSIIAKKATAYKYIIYTMNDSLDIPEVPDPNNPTFTTFVNRDFAYNVGEFNTPAIQPNDTGNEQMVLPNSVNLIRQVARVGIALNTLGMFATLKSARVALSEDDPSFKKGVFDLKTGEYISTTVSDYTGDDLVADVNNPIPNEGNYNKIAFFYTAENDEIKHKYVNLSIVVKNFTLNLDWQTEIRSFGEGVAGSSAQTIEFEDGISAQRGKTYYGTINMVESGLQYAGVKWSRTNLMYNNVIYGFRHFPDRRYIESGGDAIRNQEFWMLGAKASVAAGTLSSQPGGSDVNDDPCRRVYPYNLWITASREDWDALYSASGTQVGTGNNTRRTVYNTTGSDPYWGQFTGINTTYFIAYKATTGSTPYPNNGDLIYALGGVMRDNGNMFTANVTANYFPREFITQSKSVGRDVFVFSRDDFSIGTQNVNANSNEMWVGWAKAMPSLGRPTIRCVRNSNTSQVNFVPVSDPKTLPVQN